jgi:hypothetical protein
LESADEFYGAMGRILPQIQEGILINDTSLMSVSNEYIIYRSTLIARVFVAA